MQIAVVIPAYKTPSDILKRCLDSVIAQAPAADIIVVDSSSSSLAAELKSYTDKVRFFFPGRRMFPGEARNFGFAEAKSEVVAFLDSDCAWASGWIKAAELAMANYPEWIAFNGQILFEKPNRTWAFALHLMEFHEFLSTKVWNSRFLPSGNLLIRSSFFKEVGGFQPHWPACEDIGFLKKLEAEASLRAQIQFIPKLAIVHAAHTTERKNIFEKVRFMGFWRGFYNRELPKSFQIRSAPIFIGAVFLTLILWRSFKLRSRYFFYFFLNIFQLAVLTAIWGKGLRDGLLKSRQGCSVEKNSEAFSISVNKS
jgi:glycosyltransferase involved in cell wall biosynthesis